MIHHRGGYWQVRVYAGLDPRSGRKRHLYDRATSQVAARSLEARLRADVHRRRTSPYTVAQLLDRWLDWAEYVRELAPTTLVGYRHYAHRILTPCLGHLPVTAVTTGHLGELYAQLRRTGAVRGMPLVASTIHGFGRFRLGCASPYRILKPLKLTHTITPDRTTALPAPHPILYQQFTPGGRLVDTTLNPLLESDADGSIIATTADLNRFFQALIGGRLLPRPQLAVMQTTVPADDGGRFGLGLEWRPLPCGGGYWTHGGNGVGYTTITGATTSGRTVTISLFSRTADPDLAIRQDRRPAP